MRMKTILFVLTSLAMQQAFAASETNTRFTVKAAGYFCYQDTCDAYEQASAEILRKAAQLCAPENAIKVTETKVKSAGCSLTLEAGFTCTADAVVCRPKQYWFQCCDKSGCW